VFFPALPQISVAPEPLHSQKTGETILLVDDHAGARHSMERVLNQAGYRVLHAASGKRGLSVFSEHEREIDLLLADWMMPGMTGRELAKKLRHRKPGLKVLLISGYQEPHDGRGVNSLNLIRKPFAGNALLGRVREVLDSKGDTPC
jgi:DNA-binding response OmpR family regulator